MFLGLLSHSTFNSYLEVGLASFDCAVLSCLPKRQSLESFSQIFKTSAIEGGLTKTFRAVPGIVTSNLWMICGLCILTIAGEAANWKIHQTSSVSAMSWNADARLKS